MADEATPDPVIEDVQAKVKAALKIWEDVGATPIPKTLKEARAQKWELASDVVEVGSLMAYARDKQDADSHRVIRLEKAIEIIDTFERELISQMVVRPENALAKIKSTVESAGTIAFHTVQTIWRYGGTKALWVIVRELVQHIFVTIGAAILITAILRSVKTRKSLEVTLRRLALPQRGGERYVRRKISRR